ncbi:hypothetical protein RvY_19131 [Ramazzottius varieornatus]|uniref:Uncharacterized protein n=1 Tax=Ramazzottius varieornatus TaxID=947166 RepID=A0A1D1W8E1_RAMVA|nr:hypothetical protein RvY_19131 [Ramazzottius varieornatus]
MWEVALVELIYPHSMYNIPEDQKIVVQQLVLIGLCVHREDAEEEIASFKRVTQGLAPTRRKPNPFYEIRYDKEKNELLPRAKQRTEGYFHFQEHEIIIPAGIYDLAELFHNQSIVSATDSPAFQTSMEDRLKNYLDSSTTHQTPRFWPREDEHLTEADKSVWYLANQYPNEFKLSVLEQPFLVISKRCINLYFGDQSLFIYCDVAAYTHVGDSYEQLLRTVPIKTDSAFETVMVRFDVPHYSAVVRTFIESITVDICTDLGKDAPF